MSGYKHDREESDGVGPSKRVPTFDEEPEEDGSRTPTLERGPVEVTVEDLAQLTSALKSLDPSGSNDTKLFITAYNERPIHPDDVGGSLATVILGDSECDSTTLKHVACDDFTGLGLHTNASDRVSLVRIKANVEGLPSGHSVEWCVCLKALLDEVKEFGTSEGLFQFNRDNVGLEVNHVGNSSAFTEIRYIESSEDEAIDLFDLFSSRETQNMWATVLRIDGNQVKSYFTGKADVIISLHEYGESGQTTCYTDLTLTKKQETTRRVNVIRPSTRGKTEGQLELDFRPSIISEPEGEGLTGSTDETGLTEVEMVLRMAEQGPKRKRNMGRFLRIAEDVYVAAVKEGTVDMGDSVDAPKDLASVIPGGRSVKHRLRFCKKVSCENMTGILAGLSNDLPNGILLGMGGEDDTPIFLVMPLSEDLVIMHMFMTVSLENV